jgi:hypothetical protein
MAKQEARGLPPINLQTSHLTLPLKGSTSNTAILKTKFPTQTFRGQTTFEPQHHHPASSFLLDLMDMVSQQPLLNRHL